MMNTVWKHIFAILSVTLIFTLAAVPGGAGPAKTPGAAVATSAGAEQNWGAVVAAAKKEGKVALYALWTPKARIALTEAFKAKYGLDVEFTPFSRGTDLVKKAFVLARTGA